MFDKTLQKLGIQQLNEMQESTLKAFRSHSNVMVLSPTGSGKTLAFLLSVLQRLSSKKEGIQAVVLAPSRELAIQIEQVFRKMDTGFKVNCCYGGHDMRIEKNNLSTPPAVLIGTPGRIADHIRRGNIDLTQTASLVLDEFDKSLELGFEKEMTSIVQHMEQLKHRLLTSATALEDIPPFVGMKNYETVDFTTDATPVELTLKAVKCEGHDKLELLVQLICYLDNAPTLVFCNHREAVERIADTLNQAGIYFDVFHGGLKQEERERALIKYRNGSYNILLCTDLAARGLDIPEIKYVIHYQLPKQLDAFVHRNGRTARMHAEGTSYLVLAEHEYTPDFIEELIPIEEIPTDSPLPPLPEWTTIYIGGGKKDKINKIDIVGLFFKKGELKKDEMGKIEVLDHSSFVAVKRKVASQVIRKLRNERIKRKKVKISIAR